MLKFFARYIFEWCGKGKASSSWPARYDRVTASLRSLAPSGIRNVSNIERLESRVLFSAATPTIQTAGDVTSTWLTQNRADYHLSSGAVASVEVDEADLVRIRVAPAGTFTSQTSGAIVAGGLVSTTATISDTTTQTVFSTSQLKLTVSKSPFSVVVQRTDGTVISSDLQSGIGWNSDGTIFDSKLAPADEHYFGLGDRGGPIDRRGRTIFFRNTDNGGYSELTDPLYAATPFYYGLRNGQTYGVFVDNPATPFFDMDTEHRGLVTFGAASGELNYYIMSGPTPDAVLQTYCRLTGFPSLPPEWTLGYQQSRYGYTSWSQIQQIAKEFRQLKIPIDAMWLDLNYTDKDHIFTWDPTNYANPATNISALKQMGFHTVAIVDPAIKTDDPSYKSLAAANLLVTDSTGKPLVDSIFLGNVAWIDFSKSAARTWYSQHLQDFLKSGVSAIWNDLNEPAQNFMPGAIYNFDGKPRTDAQARDLYALLETATTFQAQQAARPGTRPWILSRSGYSGIQRYAASWSGDSLSTWDSLRVNIQMSLSMGLSGVAQFGSDVGGFLGSPSAELFTRWLEFSSLTPFFRNHSVNTASPREPWDFGTKYTDIARSVIEQRYKLLPYLYTLFQLSTQTGASPLHPTFFDFPGDSKTFTQSSAFMLGQSLLVAPVFTQGATTRSLYLPAGANWYDFYTDKLYRGGQTITVAAPLERIPIFVRAGSVLPTGPVVQYVGQVVPPIVNVDLYPGANTTFTLYEDDGTTTAYQSGSYADTTISRARVSTGVTVSVQKTAGKMAVPNRPWVFKMHDVAHAPTSVTLGATAVVKASSQAALDTAAQGWYYDPAKRVLSVRVQGSALTQPVDVVGI